MTKRSVWFADYMVVEQGRVGWIERSVCFSSQTVVHYEMSWTKVVTDVRNWFARHYSRFHIDRPKFKIYTYRRTLGKLQTLASRESGTVAPPRIVLPQSYLTAGPYIDP
jgi:hypothetical protein